MTEPISVEQFRQSASQIETEVGRVIVGQTEVVRLVLVLEEVFFFIFEVVEVFIVGILSLIPKHILSS